MGFYDKTGGPKNPDNQTSTKTKAKAPGTETAGAKLNDSLAQTGRLPVFKPNPSLRNGSNAASPTTLSIDRTGRVTRSGKIGPKILENGSKRVQDYSALMDGENAPYAAAAVPMSPGTGPGLKAECDKARGNTIRVKGDKVSHPAFRGRR